LASTDPSYLIRLIFGGCIVALQPQLATAAPSPVAIVEESDSPAVRPFEILRPGQVFSLAPTQRISIGYFRSCLLEEIEGGIVTIGADRSTVAGGRLRTTIIPCISRLDLTTAQASKSGATAVRQNSSSPELPAPSITLHALSPVMQLPAGGRVMIRRLDAGNERIGFNAPGRRVDCAELGIALTAGGLYRASFAGTEIVFSVASEAKSLTGPAVSRLILFD
jgi:hypothetical protein